MKKTNSLKSLYYVQEELNMETVYELWCELQRLKYYFIKFAGSQYEEVMMLAFTHALTHFDPEKGSVSPYIKSLARGISKSTTSSGRYVLVDFLEETLANYTEQDDGKGGQKITEETRARVNPGKGADFSDEVVEKIFLEDDKTQQVADLALEFMDKFMIMCDSLIRKDTTTIYYPQVYIDICLRLVRDVKDFNKICLQLYDEYADDFRWFLELDKDESWFEADFAKLSSAVSKRVALVNAVSGEPIRNADLEDWKIQGKLNSNKIIRIRYSHIWELMCDLADANEINEMKFILGNSSIVRTFGGSLSVLNPNLDNVYDLIRSEILTNILIKINCKVLNVGGDCFYLLCNKNNPITTINFDVKGYTFNFVVEDLAGT